MSHSESPCQDGSVELNDMKSGARFFYCIKYLEYLKYMELSTRYAEGKVFKLQRLLAKVLVHNHCKTKVQKEHLIAKEKIKMA